MIASSLLSLKGALQKFKVDKFTTFKSTDEVDWSFKHRVFKTIMVLVFTNLPIISLTVYVVKTFFWHDIKYAWFASREAVERPGFISDEAAETLARVFLIVLYTLAGIISLGLGYCSYKRCTNTSNVVKDVQMRDLDTENA